MSQRSSHFFFCCMPAKVASQARHCNTVDPFKLRAGIKQHSITYNMGLNKNETQSAKYSVSLHSIHTITEFVDTHRKSQPQKRAGGNKSRIFVGGG